MATSDIAKAAIFDQRIVQNPARYAVDKSALSLTNAPYNAIAASASQHTYNINVPSQNVFVDRAFDWASSVLISCNVAVDNAVSPYTAGQQVLRLGQDAALAAFPLQEMVATLTATINDTSVVTNLDTVLHEVLRLADAKADRLMRTCPTMLDKYASYTAADGAVNNPISSYYNATEAAEVPNGAWGRIEFCDPAGTPLREIVTGGVVGSGSYVSGGVTVNFVGGIPVRTNPVPGPEPASYPLFIKFFSTEHLVLSPFIFADAHEYSTGLFGVNNIQLVMNMKSNVSRVLRQSAYYGRAVSQVQLANFAASGSPFQDSKVNVQFLTPSLDIPLPAKSIVPFMEFPRYISSNYAAIPAGGSAQLSSQTIVLPQIPDMLIMYCKPQAYAADAGDWYLPISRITINFDNFAGLLSSHSTEQLYHMCAHNGLKMDYNQWRGYANVADGATGMARVQTTGGFLVLKPGQDITLQSGQAPSLETCVAVC